MEQEDRDKAAAVRAGDELWRNLFGEEPPGAEDAVAVRGHAEGEEMGETFDGEARKSSSTGRPGRMEESLAGLAIIKGAPSCGG